MARDKQLEEVVIRPTANGVFIYPYSRAGDYVGIDKTRVFNDLEEFTNWAQNHFNWLGDEDNG